MQESPGWQIFSESHSPIAHAFTHPNASADTDANTNANTNTNTWRLPCYLNIGR
jgi:hypothetical protein